MNIPEGFISVSEFCEREKNEGRGELSRVYVERLAVGGYVKRKKKKKFIPPVMKSEIHFKRIPVKDGIRIYLNENLRVIRGKITLEGKEINSKQ